MLRSIVLVALLGLSALAANVSAQEAFDQCDDEDGLSLVLRNPDLQRHADGLIHASGSFFVQFQAIGDAAADIATFGFSFGPVESPVSDDSGVCDLPPEARVTGVYILNYRADQNPDDGFFINLQTDLVPDGTYTAAVHAYDAANNELARAWTNAVVNNCDAEGPVPPARCEGDSAQISNNDETVPWPIMLPGDGILDAGAIGAPSGTTLSIEFAEELSDLVVTLNQMDITDQLEQWPGRLWDDDLFVGYGPAGLGGIVAPECTLPAPLHQCNNLGVAYAYTAGPVTDADVVRIEATDMAGNVAIKQLHIGSGTTGAVTGDLPDIQATPDAVMKEVDAGGVVVFAVTITNQGGGTGHPIKTVTGPPGWELTWSAHEPVEPGASDRAELSVRVPAGTADGDYPVNATISYDKGGGTEVLELPLTVRVGQGGATGGGNGGNETADDDSGGGKDSPLPVALVLVAVAVAVLRRRS